MDRNSKETVVEELKELFNNVNAAVLVDPKGLDANKVVELRKALKVADSKMRIIKNTLAKIASEGTPFEEMKDQFQGTGALVYSFDNPIGPAKVLVEFKKQNENLQIKSGLLSSDSKVSMLTVTEVEALSKLPSREELIAKLLYVLNAPITQFVRTINEVPAKFVRTLSAIAESKNN